jgi:hypothetical protein
LNATATERGRTAILQASSAELLDDSGLVSEWVRRIA